MFSINLIILFFVYALLNYHSGSAVLMLVSVRGFIKTVRDKQNDARNDCILASALPDQSIFPESAQKYQDQSAYSLADCKSAEDRDLQGGQEAHDARWHWC